MAVFVAAVTQLVAGPVALASPEPELSSSKTIVALSLTRAGDAKETVAIRGTSIGTDPTSFSAVATLSQIPCPGTYRYEAQTENQKNGALSAYSATVSLAPLSPERDPRCGEAPPPRPGAAEISISSEGEPIDSIHGRGSGSGGFFGELITTSQPECDKRYALSLDLDLRRWARGIHYRLKVLRWRAEALGQTLENHPSC